MTFRVWVEDVLFHEGGYVNDPDDPGGETKYGISKRAYPELDIGALSRDDAIAIYERDYWLPLKLDRFADDGLAHYVGDCAVNHGKGAAARLLQKALGWYVDDVTVDGVIGPVTLRAVNAQKPARDLLLALVAERCFKYREIVAGRPSSRKFLRGWIRRAFAPFER